MASAFDSARFAAVAFSTRARVAFNFNEHDTPDEVEAALTSLQFEGGATHTKSSLAVLSSQVLQSAAGKRTGVTTVVIVLTDGGYTPGFNPAAEAKALHAAGTIVYAIGVGGAVPSQLRELASAPENVRQASDYTALLRTIRAVTTDLCTAAVVLQATPPSTFTATGLSTAALPTCTKAADIVVVLDDSGSFQTLANWRAMTASSQGGSDHSRLGSGMIRRRLPSFCFRIGSNWRSACARIARPKPPPLQWRHFPSDREAPRTLHRHSQKPEKCLLRQMEPVRRTNKCRDSCLSSRTVGRTHQARTPPRLHSS